MSRRWHVVIQGWRGLLVAELLTTAVAGSAYAQAPERIFVLPPIDEFSAIVERPLFTPDRRPSQAAPDAPQQAATEPEGETSRQIVLAGTATDQAERAVAILHDVAQGFDFRVWVGDQVDGWTIKAIRPRAVILATATQEVTVTLDDPAFPTVSADR